MRGDASRPPGGTASSSWKDPDLGKDQIRREEDNPDAMVTAMFGQ